MAAGLAGDLEKIRAEFGLAVPDDLLARGALVWTSLFGAISFEVFGQYGADTFTAREELFGHHLAVLADVAGLPPAGADPCEPGSTCCPAAALDRLPLRPHGRARCVQEGSIHV